MDELEADREQIRKRIVEIVKGNWEVTQRATLLSGIGSTLRKEFPRSPGILIDGLRAFLTSWPVVQIVQHPTIREKIGAIPLGVKIPEDTSSLFQAPMFRRQDVYDHDLWKGFYLPIKERRFVVLGSEQHGGLRVIDNLAPPEGVSHYEILSSDLVVAAPDAPISEKARMVGDSIRAWTKRHGLATSDLLERSASTSRREANLSGSSADLAQALSHLNAADQSRIFVPLDLVQKMLSGKS